MPDSLEPPVQEQPIQPVGSALDGLNARIIVCDRCPRLRAWCAEVARTRRRAYRDETYWGRPVPSFGDPEARVLILGLAPGAHGSNRTGRPFTGDGSGDFLYPVLYEAGFASQAAARSRDDGMRLRDLWITSVGRCAPPDNKPTPAELANCTSWLDAEIALLTRLRVVVCLGHIAWNGYLQHLRRKGFPARLAEYPFRHSAEYEMPNGVILLGSYHPSQQNTKTGRLTREMFLDIFARARQLASRKAATPKSATRKFEIQMRHNAEKART
jgi:uracil-DNA glycosylase family 4